MNSRLHRKALILSYFTVAYNVMEGIVSIIAGVFAGSIALIGFGLDSFVESLSGGVMIWRFTLSARFTEEEEEQIESKAVRFVAVTFFILATYVLYESLHKLYSGEAPEPSLIGIIIATVSLIVMPALFLAKYRTGRSIGSSSLIADSKETLACSFLSLALLIGLGLNYLFGFWWADPAVGLVIVGYLVKEGYSGWVGEESTEVEA